MWFAHDAPQILEFRITYSKLLRALWLGLSSKKFLFLFKSAIPIIRILLCHLVISVTEVQSLQCTDSIETIFCCPAIFLLTGYHDLPSNLFAIEQAYPLWLMSTERSNSAGQLDAWSAGILQLEV